MYCDTRLVIQADRYVLILISTGVLTRACGRASDVLSCPVLPCPAQTTVRRQVLQVYIDTHSSISRDPDSTQSVTIGRYLGRFAIRKESSVGQLKETASVWWTGRTRTMYNTVW